MAAMESVESLLFYCEICDVRASSEEQLRSHLLGQRHWFNKRQQETAHRSVYVTGFKGSIEKDAVSEAFEQFGPVRKVVLLSENRPRAFAIVEFSNVDSALRALRHSDELIFQGSPLKVKPRDIKTKTTKISHSKVVSAADSSSKEEEDGDKGDSSSTAAMEGVSTWRDTLSSAHLNVSADDMTKLEQAVSADDQIQLLATLLPHEALQHRLSIVSLLEVHFRSSLPNCRVLPFGSIVTGLSTPTSDLDLTLLTELTEDDDKHFGPSTSYAPPPLSTPSPLAAEGDDSISSMDTSCDSLPCFANRGTGSTDFDSVLAILRTIPGCTKVFGLPSARCPIMRFLHLPTGVHCDLSINNRLALYNTRLIKSYLQCDDRVAPLLLVVRLWAKAWGLLGHTRTLLNNYSLSLMLIAALQSTSPPVLPSLQSPAPWPKNMDWYASCTDMSSLTISGWSVCYCDPGSLKPSDNASPLSELLQQFFDFYVSFQFSDHAVTIHTPCGHMTSIQEALDSAHSNDPAKGFKVGCMCVQDPLELSHNVTKSLNNKTFKTLQHELRRAHDIMLTEPQSVLELLSPSEASWSASSKTVKNTFTLYLTPEHLKLLFYREGSQQGAAAVSKLHVLGDVVTQLDYSNQETVSKLCMLTCHTLASYWTAFSVACSPILTTPPQDVAMDTVSTGQPTVRKRPREEEEPQDDGDMADQETELVEETKRRKVLPSHTRSDAVLDEILSTESSLSSSMSCSFNSTQSRKNRHQQQQQEEAQLVVRFTMAVSPCTSQQQGSKIAVKMTGDSPVHANLFANCYAMFKKHITGIIKHSYD